MPEMYLTDKTIPSHSRAIHIPSIGSLEEVTNVSETNDSAGKFAWRLWAVGR